MTGIQTTIVDLKDQTSNAIAHPKPMKFMDTVQSSKMQIQVP